MLVYCILQVRDTVNGHVLPQQSRLVEELPTTAKNAFRKKRAISADQNNTLIQASNNFINCILKAPSTKDDDEDRPKSAWLGSRTNLRAQIQV